VKELPSAIWTFDRYLAVNPANESDHKP